MNLLDGVNRNGLAVNQSDSNDGGCLTLGKNSQGKVGFFIYKGKSKIPPYRAYISVNKVNDAPALTFTFDDEETTGIQQMRNQQQSDSYYNLKGEKVTSPSKGVYISNGRLFIKK